MTAASGAAFGRAVGAGVADAVGEFCFQADLAGRVQLDPGLFLDCRLLPNLGLQPDHLFLFLPEKRFKFRFGHKFNNSASAENGAS